MAGSDVSGRTGTFRSVRKVCFRPTGDESSNGNIVRADEYLVYNRGRHEYNAEWKDVSSTS